MPRFLLFAAAFWAFAFPVFAQSNTTVFPTAPHVDTTIEWWYLNANLHTQSGRHLAIIASFFRFGRGAGEPQSHYLIYAITDIDAKKHYAYSFGDKNTLAFLQEAATMGLEMNPQSAKLQQLVTSLDQGSFPPPTRLISDPCTVTPSPFAAKYGGKNSVAAVSGSVNSFRLKLGGNADGTKIDLTFHGLKPPMLVNGDGNTGLQIRTDMKYISLTRNSVSGTIDTGGGSQPVTGQGWFDHQWGNSWTTQAAGWDWFGVQLANGTDVLFFQQLDLKTGNAFFPCATFENAAGNQVTTHNIVFSYAPMSFWTSVRTGVEYPLGWNVTFPDQDVTLNITPDMLDQEMPVLATGGAIWEGSCSVAATVNGAAIPGVAYMELVGYNSPNVHKSLTTAPNY